MKILLISYPVSPYRGSEFSVSWNYITEMSKAHELFVLYGTSGNGLGNVSELSRWLSENTLENVHFIDVQIKRTSWTRFLGFCRRFNYKLPFYFQYKLWHKRVYKVARKMIAENDIDLVHYLNPIGFKEPGQCWKIQDVPYVWGPVQGVENRPFCMYGALGLGGIADALTRLVVHNGILYLSPKVRKAAKRADTLFAATPKTKRQFESIFHKETMYLPENGIRKMETTCHIEFVGGGEFKTDLGRSNNFEKSAGHPTGSSGKVAA